MTVLLVEQNVRMALDVADTVYVLDHGVVVHEGPAAALAADEALIQSLAGASAEEWDLDKA
jgi:branched-chain amino acid transport system ATP-binding protein